MSLYDGKTLVTDYRQLVNANLAKLEKQSKATQDPKVWRMIVRSFPHAPVPVVIPIRELAPELAPDDRPASWRQAENRQHDSQRRRSLVTAGEHWQKTQKEHKLGGK